MIRLICEIEPGDCAECDFGAMKKEFERRFESAIRDEFPRENCRMVVESVYRISHESLERCGEDE